MKLHKIAVGVTIGVVALTACSSSKSASPSGPSGASSSSGSSTAGSAATLKVGVINDASGSAASGSTTTEVGLKAYVNAVNSEGGVNGHKIEYVLADSQSTPAGALTAAQKLVQNDKVFAVISASAFFFGAEPYLLKEGVPVVGTGFDGPEWTDPKNTNMFTASGVNNNADVFTTGGNAVKVIGGTVCGAVGYQESPSAAKSAAAFPQSCAHQGLKAGYVAQISFGSTDVAPIALRMKAAGVDSIFFSTVPSTGFALAGALRTVGATTKAILLPTGYGGDLLKSSAAVQAAQGFYFSNSLAPVELNTPATQKLQARFKAVGENDGPGFAESTAYEAMLAFAAGVTAAGDNLTPQSFITALRKVNNFDAEGLLATPTDFGDYSPAKQCAFYVKLSGNKFVPVQGLDPVCGTKVGTS
ncbi:ABC transporter substrate-binding protein [Jatrophihabitans sp. DSM 45814]